MKKFQNKKYENVSEKKIAKYLFHGETIKFKTIFIIFSALILLFSASCAHKTHRLKTIRFDTSESCPKASRSVELKKNKSRLYASVYLPSLSYDIGLKIRGNILKNSQKVDEVTVMIIADTEYEPKISQVKAHSRKEIWIKDKKSIFTSKKIQVELPEEYRCDKCEIEFVFQTPMGLMKQQKNIESIFVDQMKVLDECFHKQKPNWFTNSRWKTCADKKITSFDSVKRQLKEKYRKCGEGKDLYPFISEREKLIQALREYGSALWKDGKLNYVNPKSFQDALAASRTIRSINLDSFLYKYKNSVQYARRQYQLMEQSVKIACGQHDLCIQDPVKEKKLQELFTWSKMLLIESEARYRSNHVSKNLPTMSSKFGNADTWTYKSLNGFIDYLATLKLVSKDIQSGEEVISIPFMDAELVREWYPKEDYSASLEKSCALTMMPSWGKNSLITYTNRIIEKEKNTQCCAKLRNLSKENQESILDDLQPYLCSSQKKKMCTPCYGNIGRKKWKQDRFEDDQVYKNQVLSEVRKELRKSEQDSTKLFEKCDAAEGEELSLATLKECLKEHNETYIGCEKENREEIIKISKEFNELSSSVDVRLVLDSQNALEPYVKEFGVVKVGKVVQAAFGFESDTYGIEDPDGLSCFPVTKVREEVISDWGRTCTGIKPKCKEVNALMEKETKGLKISKCVIQRNSYPSSSYLSWALPKQKERWKILDRSFRCNQNRCINVKLEKKHFGGGEGVWIASTNHFKVDGKKTSEKSSLGYWKKSKPVHVWNTSLKGRDSVTVSLCPAKSSQEFYLQLTPR